MDGHQSASGCAAVAASIALSALAGTLAGAICDGNGLFADDAFLFGLWCGGVAIGFSIVATVQRTWIPYLGAVTIWILGMCFLETVVTGEGDGAVIVMGGFGLLSACVCVLPAILRGGPAP